MSRKVKLTKIELTTKEGKKVDLTLDEAKELHDQLHALFGAKTVYVPMQSIIIERDRFQPIYQPTWLSTPHYSAYATCEGNSGLSLSYCGDAL